MSKNQESLKDIGLLVLRLVLGITFILHGYPKFLASDGSLDMALTNWSNSVANLGVPFPYPAAWLSALSELGGGLLLVLGLFPRIGALGIAITMVIAIWKVHGQYGFMYDVPLGED